MQPLLLCCHIPRKETTSVSAVRCSSFSNVAGARRIGRRTTVRRERATEQDPITPSQHWQKLPILDFVRVCIDLCRRIDAKQVVLHRLHLRPGPESASFREARFQARPLPESLSAIEKHARGVYLLTGIQRFVSRSVPWRGLEGVEIPRLAVAGMGTHA